jgi:hypothetical protein
MTLKSTEPLTEISTRIISWGVKATGVYGWQPYRLYVPIVSISENLNLLQLSVLVQACTGIALPFTNQTQESLSRYVVPEKVIEARTSRLESKQERLISTSSRSWFCASSFIQLNKNQLDAPLF